MTTHDFGAKTEDANTSRKERKKAQEIMMDTHTHTHTHTEQEGDRRQRQTAQSQIKNGIQKFEICTTHFGHTSKRAEDKRICKHEEK